MAQSHREIAGRDPFLRGVAWTLLVLVAVFILFPVGKVFQESLRDPAGAYSLATFQRIFGSTDFRVPIRNTLLLGICVAWLGTLIGFLFAFAVRRTDVPARKFWTFSATFPMISPTFLSALALIVLLGHNGFLTKSFFGPSNEFSIYGFWGLLITETMAFFSTSFLICSGLLANIDPSLEEASLNAGSSRWSTFWKVTFPLSLPALLSSFLLIFIESLADFADPLILSGDFKVLSVEAYLRIVGSQHDLSGGAALALLLLVPSLMAFAVQEAWLRKKSFVTLTGKPSSASYQRLSTPARRAWTITLSVLAGAIYMLYGTVAVGSVTKIFGIDATLTFEHYRAAFRTAGPAVRDTLLLALVATPLSGLFGIAVAYVAARTSLRIRHLLEWGSMLTFAVPGTVVGIGYVLAFNSPPLVLQGTWLAIVLLFVFRNAPVGIRAGIAALMQMDRSIEEASTNAGATKGTTIRRIVIPLLAPAFFSGLTFSFIRCVTSISAVIFVVSAKWNLITVSIMDRVETGELSAAAALSMVIVGLCLLAVLLLKLFLPGRRARAFVTP